RQTDRQTDRQNCYIADIGGSNGDIAKMMTDEGFNMILIEPTKEACVNASKKGISNIICGYVNDNDFNPKCFDDCLLSNVLEHIEKDIDFLKCLKDKMKENAKIIILVPAFQFLWNSNDNVAKHFRRYSLKRLNKAAVEAGFKVLFSSYFFSFLFLPMLAIKILERFGFIKKYDVNNETYKNRHTGGFLTNFIIKIFNKIEIKFMRLKIKIPFGTSIALVARK
ncbi:MAG: class I SAM-dependent methyltransferase, partial [Elusimicrobiota bacterium]|nr:class I SAM-dependent methyltransferase [Elusimicrobiota bacterium]